MENYDNLTGILSMEYFMMLAESGRKRFLREGYDTAILFINLARLRDFNYRYGMAEGDELLKTIAKTLAKLFGKDNCGRIRGDHFAIFTVSEGLEDKLGELFMITKGLNDGKTVSMMVGVYLNSIEEVSISIALDRAKMACEHIKGSKESHYRFFSEKLLEQSQRRRYIIENIGKALEHGWITVYHQPVVRSANGRVSAEEALARWNDPKYGMIPPSEFVPILEETKLTYKLDLFVVDQIIKKMKMQKDAGLYLVTESVNLSRSDFDCCDMVEEIKKRMDEAGLEHKLLATEISEEMLCDDFHYVKIQIERFRELGFKVWLDGYGSGHMSPELLQKIGFDLFKLDMSYVTQMDKSKKSKRVMTEMVKLAAALGVDTAAIGVEDKKQADFLCEIGCIKHQGYYYCRPIPLFELFGRYENGTSIGFENPLEAGYYDAISRINLYDLSSAPSDETSLDEYFNTMPMSVLEVTKEGIKVRRGNKSHREFIVSHFPVLDDGKEIQYFKDFIKGPGSIFMSAARQCAKDGKRVVVEERTPVGDSMHVLIRRIARNPVNGNVAILAIVLVYSPINDWDMGMNYTYLARALSSDYIKLYLVDLDDESYVDYNPGADKGELIVEKHGEEFFKKCKEIGKIHVYKDDQKSFLSSCTKKNVIRNIKEHGVYSLTYRMMRNGSPVYISIKAVKLRTDGNHIVIGVSDIDAQMKEKEIFEKAREEQIIYRRFNALYGDSICYYTVDKETGHFIEYSADPICDELNLTKEGDDFFASARKESSLVIFPADLDLFNTSFTKENVFDTIDKSGIFILNYRMVMSGEPFYVCLRAAVLEENGREQLIVGVTNIDIQVKRDQEYAKNLSAARDAVNIDTLTGVKNKHAYVDAESHLNSMIEDGIPQKFAVVVFDINGLKEINDTKGHQAGDAYIREGCSIICGVFANSTVFRIGGDEFAVIAMESDYDSIDQLMDRIAKINKKNSASGDVVIACGMSRFDNDRKVSTVFERADNLMYKNKNKLKTDMQKHSTKK